MTARDWKQHKKELCSTCRYDGRCPFKAHMDTNPNDAMVAGSFRTGRCSQYEERPKRKRKGRYRNQTGRKAVRTRG